MSTDITIRPNDNLYKKYERTLEEINRDYHQTPTGLKKSDIKSTYINVNGINISDNLPLGKTVF